MKLGLNNLLNRNGNKVIGLDIGSSMIKAVQLHKGSDSFKVVAAGLAEITNGTTDEKQKEMNTVKAIIECIKGFDKKTNLAVCGVSGPEVALRCFDFPSLPLEDVPGAVRLEAEQICPFHVSDAEVDYQLVPTGKDNVNGILVAATNKLVKSKGQLVKYASLKNVLMDVDGLALLNCYREVEKSYGNQIIAILNVGNLYTNFAIASSSGLPFIRDIVYAGKDIIEQIAEDNDLEIQTVKGILLGRDSSISQTGVKGSLIKACKKLAVDVNNSLRYFEAQEKSVSIKKLFVCGGFALVEGFMELLNEQLGIEAVLWNPFEKVQYNHRHEYSQILKENGPALAVAAGLAMRSI